MDPILAARMLSGLVNSVVEWYRPGRPGAADLPDEVARAAFDGILPAPEKASLRFGDGESPLP